MKKILFGLIAVVGGTAAAYAATDIAGDPCALIRAMMPVFNTLRTLAFIGAAFMIAGWAWEYISTGKVGDGIVKEAKGKGVALLVGFALLMGIGLFLQFLPGVSGCVVEAFNQPLPMN